jgi:PHD/YefM family antitoxin component YafN of YafNO toxin-antitoxin module
MINIRPVSDLRNKYPEIEELVLKEDEAVYLTKNGYGSMVVMSLEKYSKMIEQLETDKKVEEKFGNLDIEKALEEAEKEANDPNTKYYSHEEIVGSLRRIIDEEK